MITNFKAVDTSVHSWLVEDTFVRSYLSSFIYSSFVTFTQLHILTLVHLSVRPHVRTLRKKKVTLSLWHLTVINYNNMAVSSKAAVKYISNDKILTFMQDYVTLIFKSTKKE